MKNAGFHHAKSCEMAKKPSRCWEPQSRLLKTLIFRVICIHIYIYIYARLNRSLPLLGPKNSSKPLVKSTLQPPKWMVDTKNTTPKLVDVVAFIFCRNNWSHKNPIAIHCHMPENNENPSEMHRASLMERQSDGTSCKDLVRLVRSVVGTSFLQGVYQWCQVGLWLLLLPSGKLT